MKKHVNIGKYPAWKKDDGTLIIKTGKWYIECNPKQHGVYAFSNYVHRTNIGHHIPVENREGIPYYPFGMSDNLPEYAREAINFMVVTFVESEVIPFSEDERCIQ